MLDLHRVRDPHRGQRRSSAGVAIAALVLGAHTTGAATIVVGPADGSCSGALFSRIQNALDAATPGDTIEICAGTYDEQLLLTKRVRVRARPGARLRPTTLAATTTSLRTGRPVAAAVVVHASATIEGLDVDAGAHGPFGCEATDPLLVGVFVRGVPIVLRGSSVHGTRLDDAPPGCTNGVGVFVQGGRRARIEGNLVSEYQRAGIVVHEAGVRALVRQNVVTGDGTTSSHAQQGIEVGFGAEAVVDGNVVRAHAGPSPPGCTLDAAIVLLHASRVRLSANQLEVNAVGILAGGRGHTIRDNVIDGGSAGLAGIVVDGDEQRLRRNLIRSVAEVGIDLAGNRNRLLANVVGDVRTTPLCEALRADAACAAVLARCGLGIWVTGRANQLVRTAVTNADVPVADDGRGTVVR